MSTIIEKTAYGGWPNCYRLGNGQVEVIATTDVGPRLIRFGFAGGPNEFVEFPDALGRTGGDEFRMYGGHRLWHAPEAMPRTYLPDNGPLAADVLPGEAGLRLAPPVDAAGIQKEMDVCLWPDLPRARITHRLRNQGPWTVELAPWALSAMAAGGTAILPLSPRGTHPADLLPNTVLVVWPYTDLSDPRWTWGRQYLLLRQAAAAPQKVGARVSDGWVAYARGSHLFVKTFTTVPGAPYADMGCSVEMFTDPAMLELETLGPLVRLAPGCAVEHVEEWWLFDGVPAPRNDAEVEANVMPRVRDIRAAGAIHNDPACGSMEATSP
jgi:hypothetical protein